MFDHTEIAQLSEAAIQRGRRAMAERFEERHHGPAGWRGTSVVHRATIFVAQLSAR
jgi:hypothetical protein